MNLAYLAGIIDGEGCIGFSKTRTVIYPRVYITNTYLPLLEEVQGAHGGDITKASFRPTAWKQAYHWRISNSRAADFLDKIYPWLRIKYGQADCVFAWDGIRPGRGTNWTPEGREALQLILDQCTWLNKKGSGFGSTPEPMQLALVA